MDWLEAQGCGSDVYGIGESLGGAILLQSLAREHRFRAVVAESAYSSFPEIAVERIKRQSPLGPWLAAALTRPFVYSGLAYGYARYGLKLWDISATDSVRNSVTPVLMIHGLLDRNTAIANSRRIAAANRATVQLWEVPGAGHVGAFGAAPEEFEHRVLTWFERNRAAAALNPRGRGSRKIASRSIWNPNHEPRKAVPIIPIHQGLANIGFLNRRRPRSQRSESCHLR